MFNVCLSDARTYQNGINVGKVFMLLKVSLEKLENGSCFSEEIKAKIERNLSEIEQKTSIDRITNFLQELETENVIF